MADGGWQATEHDIKTMNDLLVQKNDDDDDDGQEVNRTQPFQPGGVSTPYNGSQSLKMQTMLHEQTGLHAPPSHEETSFGGSTSERTPLLQDDSLAGLEARVHNVKKNSVTGLLNISNLTEPVTEDFLSKEEKDSLTEAGKRFIKNLHSKVNFSKLVLAFSSKTLLKLLS